MRDAVTREMTREMMEAELRAVGSGRTPAIWSALRRCVMAVEARGDRELGEACRRYIAEMDEEAGRYGFTWDERVRMYTS